MKKLLLLLFLMTISLGQSQTLVGTWKVTSIGVGGGQGQTNYFSIAASSGARACFFDDEYIFDADGDFHNVQQGSTFLEVWQGGSDACGTPVAPHDGSNAATYSSTATTLTLTGVGAHLGLAKVITDSEISSPSAAPASITYLYTLTSTTLTVDVALTNGAWWRFVLSNEVAAPPPPVTAPTVAANTPTQSAEDAISIFSGAYTNVGVSTFRTSWSSAADQETVSVDGNSILKYTALNYAGIDINPANQINATSMETFHIDMWTPDCTTFKVKLVDFGANGVYGGGDDKEHEVTRTPIQNGWNYFDISLSDFTGLTTRANINQLVLSSSGGAVYIDNMYFWKLPSGSSSYYVDADGDGYGAGTATISTTPIVGSVTNNTDCNDANNAIYPGATEIADTFDNDCDGSIDEGFPPTIAAPTPPARNAWDVKSIFSGAYDNVTLDELPTNWSELATAPFSVESIAGNDTWKFGGEFLGMAKYSGNGLDLSDMTTMHIDYWTPDSNIIIAKIVNTVDGGDATTLLEDPTQTGSWRSRDIPMSAFGGSINKTKITQLLIDPQSGGSTVYVDNFYFYRPATGAPSPTIGALTVPAKVIGDANFELTAPSSDSAGAFTFTSSNTNVATISGTTVTIVGAGSSVITATQAADESYGAGSTQATLVVSLNVAAPTPTIPADRVLSVYSGAAGYANIADTSFYPNWGQATQYAQVDVIGNPTLRYSNLNYQGIQLGSVLDISSYDSIHLNIYGGGTTAVNFTVINQEGGAGSTDVKREALTAITLTPGWNSVIIPVSSLTSITPGFELNRVGQLMFTGSGTIFVDNIFFSKAVPTAVAPTVTNTSFCKGSGIALTAIPSGNNELKWYTVATKGTALTSAPIPTATKTYYVAQVMSNGVISDRAAITATMNDLPTTPTPLVLTEGATVIKKVGNFIGTPTELTLTATAAGTVATDHYNWILPPGVNQIEGGSTGVITVNFADVTAGTTALDFLVSSVSVNGCVSKTAKKLTVIRTVPGAPKALTITDGELPSVLKITKLDAYTGILKERTLTLTATPNTIAGLQASSYKWVLPAAVTTTADPVNGEENTYTSTSNVIEITLGNYTNETSFSFQVYGVNSNGTSVVKSLTCSSAAPKTPGSITTPSLAKPTYNTTCNNIVTVQVPSVLGVTYAWSVDGGAEVVSGQGSNSIVINTANASATLTISVIASTDTGSSLPKILTIKKATSCAKIASEKAVAQDEFSVIAYPNPTSDVFNIEASGIGATTIEVYDMQGRLVEKANTDKVGAKLSSGIYNVIVKQGANTKTVRVIKR